MEMAIFSITKIKNSQAILAHVLTPPNNWLRSFASLTRDRRSRPLTKTLATSVNDCLWPISDGRGGLQTTQNSSSASPESGQSRTLAPGREYLSRPIRSHSCHASLGQLLARQTFSVISPLWRPQLVSAHFQPCPKVPRRRYDQRPVPAAPVPL